MQVKKKEKKKLDLDIYNILTGGSIKETFNCLSQISGMNINKNTFNDYYFFFSL